MALSLITYFLVNYPLKFNTWNGRFVNRIISEVLESANVKISHSAKVKPFTSTPVLDLGNKVAKELIPGNQYWFRVSLFCSEVDCSSIIEPFTRPMLKLSTGESLSIIRTSVINKDFSRKNVNEGPIVVHWRVRFWPTSFIFRSRYITWPSPARFLASAAQTLARVLRGSEVSMSKGGDSLVGVIGDVDLKGFVKDLTFNTEVIDFKIRRLSINLGRDRRMPAFEGIAQYATYTERFSLFKLLLDVANVYGVGKNRSLGLGYVNAEVLEQHKLRRIP